MVFMENKKAKHCGMRKVLQSDKGGIVTETVTLEMQYDAGRRNANSLLLVTGTDSKNQEWYAS